MLAVASIFVLMYGDPNEGYLVEGLYLNTEGAEKAAKEYTGAFECLVREYVVVDGEFVEAGEIEVTA
jgi:hypothetical protein